MTEAPTRPLAPLTDEELVRRYRSGIDPEEALLELYERYRAATYGFFRRRIGVAEVAAEENQELYMTVVEHLKEYRGEASFRTWLFQIAHHRISHLRRRWGVHLDERTDEVPEEFWAELTAPSDESPELQTARSQLALMLKRCLAELSDIERAVVFGQYYAGVTLQALDGELGLANRSGSRAVLIAAQRRLKRCLEQSGVDAATVRQSREGPR